MKRLGTLLAAFPLFLGIWVLTLSGEEAPLSVRFINSPFTI